MGYVLVEDGEATPYSIQQLRAANPNTSFPKHPSVDSLAEYNVFPLNYDPQPDFDIVEAGTIEQRVGGEGVDENGDPIEGFYGWWQSWTGRNRSPEELRPRMIVSPRQARLALNAAGLLVSVDAAIAAMDEPEKTVVSLEWEYATEIQRLSSWVISMGVALGLSEDELDNLFVVAKDL
jgi:hypothetical protein